MTLIINRAAWVDRALCRGSGHLFFPEGQHARHRTEVAVRICAACPVTAQCLQLALDAEGNAAAGARYGVYGGLTPAQRRKVYDRRRQRSTEQAAS
ncbi:hypothetical protein ABH930_000276 [Kitasatospora sp. GAS204A]|uniref:WhiB family transcriptional regulator n=1 Tax=unclassified Kitasatospora TaxID=2633591 RepID=UPI002473B488|nr:WhiB family transcriptional regulator [Kitasatospora sp. GAS204B]MDH6116857.1 hypothetical protein [Kitasatospora sp. GAS204B]